MTPHQLANWACANADGNGCAGLGVTDSGQVYRMWPRKPRCDVDSCRCSYFESNVCARLPIMESGPERDNYIQATTLYLRRLKDVRERLTAKRAIFGESPDNIHGAQELARRCPDCGKAMEARKRFCERCAANRRNAAKRAKVQKQA